jgi:2-oxoglutarate ferredoxin oxidoreductase subunit delta
MAKVHGTVVIKTESCKGCELCITACPQECLTLSREINVHGYKYPVLKNDGCTGCVICALVCPDSIFTVYRTPKAAA